MIYTWVWSKLQRLSSYSNSRSLSYDNLMSTFLYSLISFVGLNSRYPLFSLLYAAYTAFSDQSIIYY